MTLNGLNERYNDLKVTRDCIEKAMKKFKGTNNIENYLGYKSLQIAYECVVNEMNRFINKDWN